MLTVDRYRPSAAQRRFLGARDLHCRFQGCTTTLARCDIDHTIDAALGGETSTANLTYLCRRHHTMKHATPWTKTQRPDGAITWNSPCGNTYTDRPGSNVRFRAMTDGDGEGSTDDDGNGNTLRFGSDFSVSEKDATSATHKPKSRAEGTAPPTTTPKPASTNHEHSDSETGSARTGTGSENTSSTSPGSNKINDEFDDEQPC